MSEVQEFLYYFDEEVLMGLVSGLFTGIPSGLLGIVTYVLSALALYTMAQRRGIRKAWLAWMPVLNCWILGSLSDQYRYVVKGEVRSKRKTLMVLSVISMILSIMMIVLVGVLAFQAAVGLMDGVPEPILFDRVMGPALGVLGLCLPVIGVAIAFTIIRFMALYDVYQSMEPGNAVLFLVLSILVNVVEPFFLFFNRDKDLGMPPRRDRRPRQEEQDPFAADPFAEDKDYL